MEEMEKGKRYSAEDKGYTSKIYEIRWIPVTEREKNIRKARPETRS